MQKKIMYMQKKIMYSGTGLESIFFWGGGGGGGGDLCHFCTLKMIVHDYHKMQHHYYDHVMWPHP